VDSEVRKGLNSIIILGAWTIWRHRNDCVFNGASPRLGTALVLAKEEALLWSLARAKGLPHQISEGWVRLSFWSPIMVVFLSVTGD